MNISSHATAALSPHLINAREAARLCGVSVATWYRMDAAGRTPRPVRLSPRTVRWRHADLTDWIDAGCPPRDGVDHAPSQTDSPQSRSGSLDGSSPSRGFSTALPPACSTEPASTLVKPIAPELPPIHQCHAPGLILLWTGHRRSIRRFLIRGIAGKAAAAEPAPSPWYHNPAIVSPIVKGVCGVIVAVIGYLTVLQQRSETPPAGRDAQALETPGRSERIDRAARKCSSE